jgi:hypothetical protein
MANPVDFEGANFVYRAPDRVPQNECSDLSCFVNEVQTISCWRLTKAELAEVQRTGVVWLSVWGHPIAPQLVSGTALVTVDGRPSEAEPYIPRAPRTGG